MNKKMSALVLMGGLLLAPSAQAQINPGAPLTSGESYALLARHSNLFLDAKFGDTGNETPLIQWSQTGAGNQMWRLESLGGDQYRLVGLASGRAVDIKEGSTADNKEAILFDWSGSSNQRFSLQHHNSGCYSLVFVHSGKALGVQDGSSVIGASVVQLPNDGSFRTQWRFVKGPAGYLYCGEETQTNPVEFGEKVDLAYGVNGKFHFVNNADGSWKPNNKTFGDPYPGAAKSLYYKRPISGGPGDGYTYCVPEGGVFSFTQPVYVAYGANGRFNYKTLGSNQTISFNNDTFGDPAPSVYKSGWFKTIAPNVPKPVTGLSQENLNRFIQNYTDYNKSGPAYAYEAEIRSFLEKMGGDHFVNRLWTTWNHKLYITPDYDGVARAYGPVEFGLNYWNRSPFEERVGVLVHEFTHVCREGNVTKHFYDAETADSSKVWHGYARTSPAEFIADGCRWILAPSDISQQQTIFDRHPAFYLYMINTFCPDFFTRNWMPREDA